MITSPKMIDFIIEHAYDDTAKLKLKYSGKETKYFDFDFEFAIVQIEARRRARKKLPSFIKNKHFLFPSILAEEQATNEAVARFHASLIPSNSSILDITAGLGIDDIEFAKAGLSITSCEIDSFKCETLRHNAEIFGLSNKMKIVNCDSINYVNQCNRCFDIVFADPARRNDKGGRVHAFSDCQPDILSAMPDLLKIASRLLIKSSPLLDLSLIRDTVSNLRHIYVVCFKGECKEVLIDIHEGFPFEGATVVDLDWEGMISSFSTKFNQSDSNLISSIVDRKQASDYHYLYEPNSGVMKTGAWKSLYAKFPHLHKAGVNTHIFLSDVLYVDFPGRVMAIYSEPDKKALKGLRGSQINIVSRNHPLSAPQIANKFALTAGSDKFLYAFRYRNSPTFVMASPVSCDSNDILTLIQQ